MQSKSRELAENWSTKFYGRLSNLIASDAALLYGSLRMRHPGGTIVKRGKNAYRARMTLRGLEYSRTHTTAGEAGQWLLDLRLSAESSHSGTRNPLSRITALARERLP